MKNQLTAPLAEADAPARLLTKPVARRSFLRYTGTGLALGGLMLAGCDNDDPEIDPNANRLDVGSGDTGILNYAYALEQLEAAFYTQVVAGGAGSYFATASAAEKAILTDLRDHEVIHREFFKAALGSAAIKQLEVDFSSIDFNLRAAATGATRMGVLDAAKAFEDLGVAAYNGAGRFISSNDNLVLAGKIVSVEARHAALIRELLTPNTFVADDVVEISGPNARGTERSKRPQVVLETANNFLAAGSKLSANSFV
ncbi:ferritin-like domain-containing protein [Hymenobacter arizonensis]|uniref:Ferritin-like domain-containing protein n=1 Tax=Hymenobacter arizonensis TaxID=1227077 RepID=A0A1I5UDN5_HYMAR|nr:ferritin-like domain-containing protein [Hymenobacter arizonensis]SFP93361.1 Ferritin-like domain-containing protein [Hymenobacter arizonensis]